MKKSTLFIACIFVTLFNLSNCLSNAEDVRKTIEAAIISNLVDKFGSNGTINDVELKKLIDAVIGGVTGEINTTAVNIDTRLIADACSSADNLTLCKHVIAAKCLDREIISNLYTGTEGVVVQWTDVFPALVYHHVSGACQEKENEENNHRSRQERPSSVIAWSYSTGFVCATILLSNIGVCLSPLKQGRNFKRLVMFLVALAVGTLAGTGFMVLLPEALQLTGEDSPVPNYYFKMATALGGIYFFYMSEKFLKVLMKKKKDTDMEIKVPPTTKEDDPVLANSDDPTHNPQVNDIHIDDTAGADDSEGKVTSVIWLVMTVDTLHNFVAGLSIGAAFTVSLYLGVSVGISILCEQMPHELGDVTMLHNAGLSKKRAVLYNFLVALTALVGLVIGILLSQNTNGIAWIFAISGGMFIYISLVNILPEMVKQVKQTVEKGMEKPLVSLILQNIGLLAGFCIILLLIMFVK